MRFVTRACLSLSLITPLFAGASPADASAWPEATAEAKPWTRWWWPGSAVTDADLTDELEAFARVGIGGVEITPVYGAKGYESRWLDHLSPEWLDRLEHTLREAKRLGLGVDLAGGTGWNFGGPTVGDADAAKHVVFRRFTVRAGEQLGEPVTAEQQPWVRFVLNQVYTVAPGVSEHDSIPTTREEPELVSAIPVPDVSQIREPLQANPNLQQLAIDQIKFHRPLPLQTLMAYEPGGEVLNLTERVGADGKLTWTAPAAGNGEWTLLAVFQSWNGKLVERAGPGGEGFMIDHFSPHAITHYLEHLDDAFEGRDLTHLRAFFNDSYEVDDARHASDWTDDFFSEFRRRRGYDLRTQLPALFANDGGETHIRVLTDYRETLSDLLLDRFTLHWSGWSAERGKQIRNQAHGSPANILDLYAASDIPETEGISLPHIKFASSAAHVSGRPLVSAEAVTFLNENFRSTPAQIRDNLRRYWLGGVNHVVYHGTAFSPSDEAWPGWFFYVATHLNPQNSIWDQTAAVHRYAARVQSFLQAGRPDNDVLLYWPIHDRYAEPSTRDIPGYEGDGPRRRLATHFRTDGNEFETTAFGRTASHLIEHGYAVDYISDRQLQTVDVADGRLKTGGASYQTIILPRTRYLPPGTFARLLDLAEAGATVLITELPADVPGLSDVDARRKQLRDLSARLSFEGTSTSGVRRASLGEGSVLLGENLDALLAAAAVRHEPLVDQGLRTIRRRVDGDTIYYIVNDTANAIDGWIPLGTAGVSAMQLNPESGDTAPAALRTTGTELPEVYLQLEPGGSRILRLSDEQDRAPAVAHRAAGPSISIDGPWQLTFLTGGPVLPQPATVTSLGSWTTLHDPEAKRFAGTARYATRFARPDVEAAGWWIDLGSVAETAEIRLNGQSLGIRVGPTYRVFVPAQALQAENLLEIDVANLAANRIADLDRRGVAWKKMYNNNIRPLRAENRDANGMFTAKHWESVASGLIGPVTVTPVEFFDPTGVTNPKRQTGAGSNPTKR